MRTTKIGRVAIVVASLVAVITTAAAAGAGAATALPVVYSVIPAGTAELMHPYAAPPGANDWTCKPSAAHPQPVVLLHGLSANMTLNWNTISPLLKNNGYCVYALTYGQTPGAPFPIDQVGGVQAMEQSVVQVSAFVDGVLASTGARKVDLVGHSEGTVMSAYYIKLRGGAPKVAKDVALTPLYDGTNLADVVGALDDFAEAYGFYQPAIDLTSVVCGSCLEFGKHSVFLNALNAGAGPTVPGVQYTNIATMYDELVSPYTSGFVTAPNVTNITVQQHCATDFAEHAALAFDRVAAAYILNALDPAHPRPVPCTLVLPLLGG
jgi:pimeloyl-ACP methyl ester carboxylesterase